MQNATPTTRHDYPTCPAEPWCTVTEPSEHADFHAGDLVRHDPPSGDSWMAYLVRDTSEDFTSLVLEGIRAGQVVETIMDARAARALLEACEDAELLALVGGLLSQVADR